MTPEYLRTCRMRRPGTHENITRPRPVPGCCASGLPGPKDCREAVVGAGPVGLRKAQALAAALGMPESELGLDLHETDPGGVFAKIKATVS